MGVERGDQRIGFCLADRKMVDLEKKPSGDWFADLTRLGVDLVEYTVECGPGIARPEKYWSE